jgi:hypothetical protein
MSINRIMGVIYDNFNKYNSGVFEENRKNGIATYCNLFVGDICREFNFNFNNACANDMIEVIENAHDFENAYLDLEKINFDDYIYLAYQKGEEHGHICPIIIGGFVYSNKWNRRIPRVANIGATNFIGKGLSWAFEDMPKITRIKI